MSETKTIQKTWSFTPQIISELVALCERDMRSQQNLVEMLIHQAYEAAKVQPGSKHMLAVQGLDGVVKVDATQVHP